MFSQNAIIILAIDFIVGALFLGSTYVLMGLLGGVQTRHELAERDNKAFGITFAGMFLSVAIVLTTILSGDSYISPWLELIDVLLYGAVAVAMIYTAFYIFDRLGMRALDMRGELMQGNIAAGTMMAGNAISTALVIRSALDWVPEGRYLILLVAVGAFFVSQIVLIFVACMRIWIFNRFHKKNLQNYIKEGNVAVAVRFSGFRIGVALAIAASFNMVSFDLRNMFSMVVALLVYTAIFVALQMAASFIMRHITLFKIKIDDEVLEQSNSAIGFIQAAIFISLGLAIFAITM